MALMISLTILVFLESSLATGEEAVIMKSNKMPCLIGKNHTLTCIMQAKTAVVSWTKGNEDILKFIDEKCHLNPKFKGKYNCLSNRNENEFQLIILNVTKDNNRDKVVCTDGVNNKCTLLYVAEEEQKLEETENGTVTAISACSQEENISIEWFKINVNTNKTEKFKPKVLNMTLLTCSNDECGGNSKKYREKISIVPDGNGTKYYLRTNVTYGNGRIVSKQTSDAYEIEEDGPIENENNNDTQTVVGIVVGVVGVVVVVVVVGGVIVYKTRTHIRSGNSTIENEMKGKADPDPKANKPQYKTDGEHATEENEVFIKPIDDDNEEGSNDGTPSVIPDTGQSSLPSSNIVDMMKSTKGKEQAVEPIGTKPSEKGEAREIKATDDKDILDDESAGKRNEGLGASHNVKETKKEDVEKRDGITGEKEVKEDKPFGYTHGLGEKESGISDGYNMSTVLMLEKISNWSTKWSPNTGPESVKGYSDQGSSEGCASPLVPVRI